MYLNKVLSFISVLRSFTAKSASTNKLLQHAELTFKVCCFIKTLVLLYNLLTFSGRNPFCKMINGRESASEFWFDFIIYTISVLFDLWLYLNKYVVCLKSTFKIFWPNHRPSFDTSLYSLIFNRTKRLCNKSSDDRPSMQHSPSNNWEPASKRRHLKTH